MNLETDKILMYAYFLLHVSDGLLTQGLNGTCTKTGTKLACIIFCGSFHSAAKAVPVPMLWH